jgi:hypothetical protein
MNKNQNIAALKKTVASLTEKRTAFLASLADTTSKLNSANSELATLMGAPAPQMLRVAGMTKTAAQTKGENENKWIAKYGKRCRLQDKTKQTFNLTGDREEMIGKFMALRESGKAVLTVTGWQSAVNTPAKVNAAKPSAKKAEKKTTKQNKKATPSKAKPAAKKVSKPAPKKSKPVAKPAAKVSAKAAALAAEIAKDKRPTPAAQVAIMG